jgi:hypothetical protein
MLFLIRWFWKCYWVYLFFLFYRLTWPLQAQSLEAWIDIGMMLPSLLGLFGFAFQIYFLDKSLWKLYCVTLVTWDFYYHFLLKDFPSQASLSIEAWILLITLMPMYVGLFQYAFLEKQESER